LSVEAKVTILHVSAKEKDADIHGGSRVNQVGLPMVAEILNGTQPSQKRVRQEMQPNQGSSQKTIYGAWRLWFEHPPKGGGAQCQNFGSGAPAMCDRQALRGSDSNPDHSFEIHPVFAVNGVAAARTMRSCNREPGSFILLIVPLEMLCKRATVAMNSSYWGYHDSAWIPSCAFPRGSKRSPSHCRSNSSRWRCCR